MKKYTNLSVSDKGDLYVFRVPKRRKGETIGAAVARLAELWPYKARVKSTEAGRNSVADRVRRVR